MAERPDDGYIQESLLPERWITVDHEQTERVLGALLERFEAEGFPYNHPDVRLPQDPRHMPSEELLPRGGKEHAMFMWTACYYMRGGIRSNDAVRMLSALYEEHPDFFVAETAQFIEPEMIASTLERFGLGWNKDEICNYWVANAKMMTEQFNGDPRAIFDGVTDYKQCLELIQNVGSGKNRRGFYGFQEKMVSMITYFLMDEGLIEEFTFPLPVDFHVMRVSVANELVKFHGYADDDNLLSDELLATLRDLFEKYAHDHNMSTLRLCDAVWLLSNSLCRRQPGNVTFEPNGREGRQGRATLLIAQKVNTSDPAQQRAYDHSCRQCPISGSCKWNIPSANYYISGDLKRRGERVEFPSLF